MRTFQRANTVIATVVLLGAVVVVASTVGFFALGADDPNSRQETKMTETTASVTTSNTTTAFQPEQRDVQVGYERANNTLFIVVHSGEDLEDVTSLSVDGGTVKQAFDTSTKRSRAKVTIKPPTSVTVTATFADGNTQVIAEWAFE